MFSGLLRRLTLAGAVALALASCSDPETARRVLAEDGYTSIRLTGQPWFACGKDDFYADEFEATNAAGHRVRGVVCSGAGWGKATTIRRY